MPMIRAHYWFAISVAVSLSVVAYCIFAPSAGPRLASLWKREARLQQESQLLQQRIAQKTIEVQLLSSDTQSARRYLEKVAREEMSFLRSDEVFIVLHGERNNEKNLYP